ncbi:MAG: GHMP kinase [Bacteroidales bacterium]|nr:GHMP kinase [Bacteroidales bacterium]
MDNIQTFKSNGKLLLTGEYLVLYGANALAMPVNKGQQMEVRTTANNENPKIIWEAHKPDGLWFCATFKLSDLSILETSDAIQANKLQLILITLQQLNPTIFANQQNYYFRTRMDFAPEWGFGSSSTLIVMLSRWAKINPYTLLNFSFGGSGYDIACGMVSQPIIYQLKGLLPKHRPANFDPPFKSHLYFVYQGKKQDSAKAIRKFQEETPPEKINQAIQSLNKITDEVVQCKNFDVFCELLKRHETLIAGLTGLTPIQAYYPDFKGVMKSLGAWGGDFLLAASLQNEQELMHYFKQNKLSPVFRFDDLTIKSL